MHLHALLDDYGGRAQTKNISQLIGVRKRQEETRALPSNGFIKASLAIVAQAPLVANRSRAIIRILRLMAYRCLTGIHSPAAIG
jgi:hypothetical protein